MPVILRPPKVACPVAFVVCVVVPPSVPLPLKIEMTTCCPGTVLFCASRTCTTGAPFAGKFTPSVATDGGCTRMITLDAGPALSTVLAPVRLDRPTEFIWSG